MRVTHVLTNISSTRRKLTGYMDELQIFAGVLLKYVNLGKGWRHRLFVLRGGVLRYYKV
jgi:hypothetical protein